MEKPLWQTVGTQTSLKKLLMMLHHRSNEVLAWTTIDTISALSSRDTGTNNNNFIDSDDTSLSHKLDSILPCNTVIDHLLLTYIVWIVQAFISISSCGVSLKLQVVIKKIHCIIYIFIIIKKFYMAILFQVMMILMELQVAFIQIVMIILEIYLNIAYC